MTTDQENLRKVAILVSMLPRDEARQLLMSLEEDEATAVLRMVDESSGQEDVDRVGVLLDFVRAHKHTSTAVAAMGTSPMRHLRWDHPNGDTPFGFLRGIPVERIVPALAAERPQTTALVLAHLPSGDASQIMRGLPAPFRAEVIRRIAELGPTDRQTVRDVEHRLEERLGDCITNPSRRIGGVHFIAEVLRQSDPATEHEILEEISSEDPQLGSVIRRSLNRFTDITDLSDREIRLLLQHVDSIQWAVALRGCSTNVLQRVLGNMPRKSQDTVRQQMRWLGPVRPSKVEQEQGKIVELMRTLQAAGLISAPEYAGSVD